MGSSILDACGWIGLILFALLVVQVVRLAISDADLTLQFCTRFGKKPDNELRGKIVWITGASSGIGESLAYALAKCGAQLILSARREEELNRVRGNCKDQEKHMVLPLDLLQYETHQAAVEKVIARFGKVDYLVNNAGRSQRAVAMETTLAVDKAALELNTLGTISLTKATLPHLVKQGGGAIVVISSVAGKMGSPGSASYSATKHALQGFFDTLRMEIADTGVDVLSVCPGPVESKSYDAIFTSEIGKAPPQAAKPTPGKPDSRMSGERCAYLISVAMANRLDEVWISLHPILFFTYLMQYMPGLAMRLGKRLGNQRLKALQAGKQDINGSFFKKIK
ncbi:hypothetical protein EMCRGX_G032573 [Ephydatia muelleri]